MIVISRSSSLFAYTYSHFCVDFACFFILFHFFKPEAAGTDSLAIGFLLYNVIAFGLQPVIGYICDFHPKIPIGLIGCALVTAGLFLSAFPFAALMISAFGNACFHIGGGIDSLRHADGKMVRSGIFVSAGALGVSFGTMTGNNAGASLLIPLAFLFTSAIFLLLFTRKPVPMAACRFETASEISFSAVIALALLAVVIRSFAGNLIPMEWKTASLMLLPGICAFAGKGLGGFLGDLFGSRRTGVLSLLISIPFLVFGKDVAAVSAIGIILFNVTMPITLCAVASKLPYHPGLAFGLTTLSLLCGVIPVYFFTVAKNIMFPVLILMIVISTVCIFLSTKNNYGGKNNEKTY